MMVRGGFVTLLACGTCAATARASGLAENQGDVVVEKAVNVMDSLADRSLQTWPKSRANLDAATLGKTGSGQLAIQPASRGFAVSGAPQRVQSLRASKISGEPKTASPFFATGASTGAPYLQKYVMQQEHETTAHAAAGSEAERPPATRSRTSNRRAVATKAADGEATSVSGGFSCAKSLLVLLDANPYLSPGSQQAVKTAGQLASSLSSKLTVAFVDPDVPDAPTPDFATRGQTVDFYLEGLDKDKREVVELKMKPDDSGSTLVADMAEDMEVNLVLVGSDIVHKKVVDTNLLAEFLDVPYMVLQ